MASVIGTHLLQTPGGPLVHVPPNGQSAWSDYAVYVNIYEMGYVGAQSGVFSGGVITTSTSTVVTGNGVTDDSAAINAAFSALAGSGLTLYFPTGTFLVSTNALNTQGVNFIVGTGATFTGTYAGTMTPPVGPATAVKGSSVAGFCRAVMTTVATSTTYTGTTTNTLTFGSNAGIGTQDGITTLAVGDCVFLPGGTLGSCAITACDTGPWIISVLGSGTVKCVLTRPTWYQTGQNIPIMYQVTIGPEGTQFFDSKWTSWANTPATATASIIPVGKTATDPLFYPDHVAFNGTLSSGFFTTTTIPIRSLTQSSFAYQPTNYSGGTTTAKFIMGTISSGGAATAVGYIGTGSVSITACAVAGTVVAGDVSTGILHIWNRP
jgi:hypothetical protein